jgi:outer membrane lipoprotein SlyB
MSPNRKRACALSIAIISAFCTPALAQDYRYQNAEDASRQNVAPPQQPQPAQQVQQQTAPVAPPPALCTSCGTVDAIRTTEKPGEGSAVGLIAGGLLGGLLGHQVGQGRGNTAATIVGAAGGAFAGQQVEKNVKKATHYDVIVRMDDGTQRTAGYDVEPGFRAGDKVKFIDGKLVRN